MSIQGRWAYLGLGALLLVAGACANTTDGREPIEVPTATSTAAPPAASTPEPQSTAPAISTSIPTTTLPRISPTIPPTATLPPSTGSTSSCGVEVRGQGLEGLDRGARECLLRAALAGQPAEFTSTRLTVEGDPIVYVVRVLGPGAFEVVADNTSDMFAAPADRALTSVRCTRLVQVLDGTNDLAIEVSGCTDGSSTRI